MAEASSDPALRRATKRAVIYLLIVGAALLFAMPFVWLVASSLKPIEQAMSLPPSFVPRAHYASIDGVRLEITRDYLVSGPGFVADVVAGEQLGRRVFVNAEEAAKRGTELRIVHATQPGWWHVSERMEATDKRVPRWDIVEAGVIETKIRPRWENYPAALNRLGGTDRVSFWRFLGNTLLVCVLGVVGTVFSNAIVAYGFARLKWKGRDAFFALTLATMMVPFPVLMVPLYGVFRSLGLIGSLVPLWLPAFFGSAFNIFLMRQFFRSIPEELSEAARIDGCSEWRIFWRIILPLSKPVLITAGVFHFLYAWNDFLGPLLYLTRTEDYTLAIALQSFQSQAGGVQWHYLMAASTVIILPVIVLFFFAQKTFVQGIATTGSKG
ncbi:MAG TPA: carbohydrate ABC transporter permease [Opitutaceae bacterium]|nr:carbohydrate ABC transporter permease [Opitutaceae bacterium]